MMEDLLASLYVIAGVVVITIAIFVLSKAAKDQKTKQIKLLAASKGWEYTPFRTPLSWGFRLETLQWVLEATSQSLSASSENTTSNISHSTRWFPKNKIHAEGNTLIIGPRPVGSHSGPLNQWLIQKATSLFLGDLSSELHEISIDSSGLSDKFLVLANDELFAHELMTNPLQRELMQWQLKTLPIIKIINDQLTIELNDMRVEKPQEIASITQIGEILFSKLR